MEKVKSSKAAQTLRFFKRLMCALRLFSPEVGFDCGFVTFRLFLSLRNGQKLIHCCNHNDGFNLHFIGEYQNLLLEDVVEVTGE